MKKITLLGLAFFIGLFAGAVAVYGWYNNNPVVCICTPVEGGTEWSGKDCPRRIKRKLKRKYSDTCPSPS
jgi:hypothetical protein